MCKRNMNIGILNEWNGMKWNKIDFFLLQFSCSRRTCLLSLVAVDKNTHIYSLIYFYSKNYSLIRESIDLTHLIILLVFISIFLLQRRRKRKRIPIKRDDLLRWKIMPYNIRHKTLKALTSVSFQCRI